MTGRKNTSPNCNVGPCPVGIVAGLLGSGDVPGIGTTDKQVVQVHRNFLQITSELVHDLLEVAGC